MEELAILLEGRKSIITNLNLHITHIDKYIFTRKVRMGHCQLASSLSMQVLNLKHCLRNLLGNQQFLYGSEALALIRVYNLIQTQLLWHINVQNLLLFIKSDPLQLQHLVSFTQYMPEKASFLQYFLNLVRFDVIEFYHSRQ